MVTPFTATGDVDIKAARRVAKHLIDTGHDGIVLNGTTGESPTTHGPEKTALIEAVVDEVDGRAIIVAGACSNDTAHAVRMAQAAESAGADGLLAVTPYYNRPSQEGIALHFEAIADSTGLPVMLYDIPGRTAAHIEDDTLDRLARHDRIVAVKDATGDVPGATRRMNRTGLAWYSGDDALNLAFLSIGASGVVSVVGHVSGRQWAEMVASIDAGDLARARAIDAQLEPAVRAIMGAGIGAVMAKASLELAGVIDNRVMRLPNVSATETQMNQLRGELVGAGLL